VKRADVRIIAGMETLFRIDDCLLTPDDAMEALLNYGVSKDDARDYLNSLDDEVMETPK
jgi:hypothetical protein